MSIEKIKEIDVIQVSKDKACVNLVVVDGFQWPDNQEAGGEYLYMLQEKLNSYIAYYESGQLLRDYPDVKGMKVRIQVYGKYDRPPYAVKFYDAVRPVIQGAGMEFEFILKD